MRLKWDALGFDPATLQAMADEFGRIHEDVQTGRKTRWRIYLGRRDGRVLYLSGLPTRLSATPPRFASRHAAEAVLEMMRSAIRSGENTPDEVIDAYLPSEYSKELIETHVERYVTRWRALVESSKRSPNSLLDIERWTKPGGLWGWWNGRDIRLLTNGDVEQWHAWLAVRPRKKRKGTIRGKTQANASGGFKAFLNWAATSGSSGTGQAWAVPIFPVIDKDSEVTATISPERVLAIIEAVPWDRRGIFLAQAGESVRFSAAASMQMSDVDPKTLELHWYKARKGRAIDSPVGVQKNKARVRREPWLPELRKWLEWRIETADPEAILAGRETALFWNPYAANARREWGYDAYRNVWDAACEKMGEDIAPQAGTRHSILSKLAEILPEATLQNQSMHRDRRSLAHYTVGARPDPVAMVRAIRPKTKAEK